MAKLVFCAATCLFLRATGNYANTTETETATKAVVAQDSLSREWRPGIGTQCHGIWSKRWADPESLEFFKQHIAGTPLRKVVERFECPYGRALPGDVTWPSPPGELKHLVAPLTILKVIAVGYAYLPYTLGARATVSFLRYRGTRQLWVLLWLLLLMSSNELILKKIWREPRPGTMLQVKDFGGSYVGSCLSTCGMPSSHAAIGVGWFVLLFLDGVYRVRPFALGRKTQTMAIRPDAVGFEKAKKCLSLYLWIPWGDRDLLTHTEFAVYISAWFSILMPVPFMRVVLYDHNFTQVTVGSCFGIAFAIAWWRVVRYYQRKYHYREGQRFFYDLLVHNHKLTQFHITNAGDFASEMPTLIGAEA